MADKGAKAVKQRRVARWMRSRGWNYQTPKNGVRRRVYDLLNERHPWWDWGHRLMILTGMDHGGNWGEVRPETWWYRRLAPERMWRTSYPRYQRRRFQVVTDYDTFRKLTDGLNEDEMYKWLAIGVDQDCELILGHRYWGGPFYGMQQDEAWLLRRYLRMWRRLDWFGLRSWLYAQALHAAVHRRKPRTCQEVPPEGQGGYSHWYCQMPRRHVGAHRFNNYVWTEVDGEPIGTVYMPESPRS